MAQATERGRFGGPRSSVAAVQPLVRGKPLPGYLALRYVPLQQPAIHAVPCSPVYCCNIKSRARITDIGSTPQDVCCHFKKEDPISNQAIVLTEYPLHFL